MEPLSKPNDLSLDSGDGVSVLRWLAVYAAYLAMLAGPLAILLAGEPWTWDDWIHRTSETFRQTDVGIKLLGLGLYLSLCCTFLPLPTGWIIAGVATRAAAVGPDVWTTTLLVAGVGAAASMMANLHDYHLMTWMLRSHRIAAVRNTALYEKSSKWFSRSPFFWLVVFNFLPIPVDVVRMLSVTYRYPRIPFAISNFLGRFIRYAIIAYVTYACDLGWIAPVALLVLAAVMGLAHMAGRFFRKPATPPVNE
jgi:membrane protein YqaA with SNARE-associated domain